MFQRILVVLDEDVQSQHCVLNIARGFAQANHAHLCVVNLADELNIIPQELTQITHTFNADLVIVGPAIAHSIPQPLPCSILIVQQVNNCISMTMRVQPKSTDSKIRNQLEQWLTI